MNKEKIIITIALDKKRQYYLLSKKSLAELLVINGSLFRDIFGYRKSIPEKHIQKIEDFIYLPSQKIPRS